MTYETSHLRICGPSQATLAQLGSQIRRCEGWKFLEHICPEIFYHLTSLRSATRCSAGVHELLWFAPWPDGRVCNAIVPHEGMDFGCKYMLLRNILLHLFFCSREIFKNRKDFLCSLRISAYWYLVSMGNISLITFYSHQYNTYSSSRAFNSVYHTIRA